MISKCLNSFLFWGLLLFSNPILAQKKWQVGNSSVTFKIKNAGFIVDGSIVGLKANINFDAKKSYSNTIEATVDVKTITTNNSARDKHIRKPEFFDVEKYSTIALSSGTFAKQTDDSFKGYFKLIIKNVTKDVVIPFTFIEKESEAIFTGTFTINRLHYNVGESSLLLSNNVTIVIKLNVFKN
jgi:polyisoprenoid-binding protein YceI